MGVLVSTVVNFSQHNGGLVSAEGMNTRADNHMPKYKSHMLE